MPFFWYLQTTCVEKVLLFSGGFLQFFEPREFCKLLLWLQERVELTSYEGIEVIKLLEESMGNDFLA